VIDAVAGHILALPAWLALLAVFVLPAMESSVFVGFVFPGEIALIIGGVLASQGRVPLAAVLVAGIVGAVVGDSIGYLVGRRYGRRLLEGTLGRFIRHHHFDRSERYLADRGGPAVLFGRFTASLRAIIPGLAGMSRMPYRRFAFYNVTGGVAWASFTVMVGFLGGSSWQHVAHLASRIGIGALVVFVLAIVAGRLLRRTRQDTDDGKGSLAAAWVRTGDALVGSRPGRWVNDRFPVQVAFLGRRLDPSSPAGLLATCLLLVAVACAWTFGGLTEDVVAHDGLALSDPTVHSWVLAHRTHSLDLVMKTVTWAGSNVVLVPALVLAGLLLRKLRGSWRPAIQIAITYGAAVLGHAVVADAVQRVRPPAADWLVSAGGWSYPSGHTTQVTAWCGALLIVVAVDASRRLRVAAFVSAVAVVALVGASRVYLGVHWLTDVLGGLTLSAAVVCLVGAVALSRLGGPDPGGKDEGTGADTLSPVRVA
jgi:membrane protein DedA with SNARE-associated domain/membrane-associated phospholipid phosphatase